MPRARTADLWGKRDQLLQNIVLIFGTSPMQKRVLGTTRQVEQTIGPTSVLFLGGKTDVVGGRLRYNEQSLGGEKGSEPLPSEPESDSTAILRSGCRG